MADRLQSYPLRLVTLLGLVTICLAMILLIWILSDAMDNQIARSATRAERHPKMLPKTTGSARQPSHGVTSRSSYSECGRRARLASR